MAGPARLTLTRGVVESLAAGAIGAAMALVGTGVLLIIDPYGAIDMDIDWQPLVNGAVQILTRFLLLALMALVGKAYAWLGLKQEEASRKTLETALQNSIPFALQQVGATISASLARARTGEDSAVVQKAAEYVEGNVPDAMRRLKVTPEKVPDLVKARLGQAVQGTGAPAGG